MIGVWFFVLIIVIDGVGYRVVVVIVVRFGLWF